ncbi:hypothetical protein [Nostoc sp.]|uniref:hypothetical protein n=1 Tax=Nostoc sp. TaxID=1180 RepID=UPI002FF6DD9C
MRSAPKYWIGDALLYERLRQRQAQGKTCGGLRLRILGIKLTIIVSMGLAIGLLFLHSRHKSH